MTASYHSWLKPWLCLVMAAISSCGQSAMAFGGNVSSFVATRGSAPPFVGALRRCRHARTLPSPLLRMTTVEIEEPEEGGRREAQKRKRREDPNGIEFSEGTVVRVVSESTRAHQVPRKGRGTFDSKTKEFIPAPGGGVDRKSRCLEVPVGLRGVVMRVIDLNGLSASHPVQVKFTPGENIEEGFNAPVPFLMHFACSELEVVME